ncbi:MAG TPA: aldo/keto reductase, partial [Actinomycetota bacterium]|nr:aldo/keto reductase [Actinomycetota bacterium]
LGLGLAALGRPAYIDLGRDRDLGPDRDVEALERRCPQVLDAAYAAGVRYLDAARSYGRAEEFLASWLRARDLDPAEVTVGSKWGYTYVGDWRMDADTHEVKDHSLPALTRQTAETRSLLGDHLDLYQIHSATLDSGVLEDRAVLDELTRLHDQGLVIGLSTSGPAQPATIRRALELTTAGRAPFGCVQATWNLLEPSAGPALAEAGSAGWGVIVKEAVANGRLTPHGRGPAADALARIAATHDVGPDAVALAAVLANPWADVVLSGAVTPDQLESNLAAPQLELAPDELEELTTLAEPPDQYWQERATLPWD